jgi:1-acyl-sn-glycerol-3-phosphate acyltransferase
MAESVKQVRRPRTTSAAPQKTPRRSSAAKTARRRIREYEAEARTPPAPPATTPKRRHTKTSAAVPVVEGIQAGDELLRQELMQELDGLVQRLQRFYPSYAPSALAPKGMLQFAEEFLGKLTPEIGLGSLTKLRGLIGTDLLDVDTWKGMWFMLNATVDYQNEVLKRRLSGDYETDPWGLDREILDTVMPFFNFMYNKYWRVEMDGLDNIPVDGRAMLVSNHSGQLPWDGAMIATGLLHHHPAQRLVRCLYASWFPTLPILSDLLTKCGQVLATEDNGTRLLQSNELVAVFPEGYKGVGKLYKDRYHLARFGRGGFIKMALRGQAPIIPVAVVGAEETYISLHKSDLMAKLTGFPYFPISPTFPWLGLLGFIPLPTKWYIDFGEPIATDSYGPDAADNLIIVSRLTDQVRAQVQDMINTRLAQRRSVFTG